MPFGELDVEAKCFCFAPGNAFKWSRGGRFVSEIAGNAFKWSRGEGLSQKLLSLSAKSA